MSMNNYANCGMVIAAAKLIPLLPVVVGPQAAAALKEQDLDTIESLFGDFLPKDNGLCDFDSVFVYDGNESNDALEEGVMYVMWDANVNPFYTRVLTPTGQKLKEENILPEFTQWVTFG